MPPAPPPQSSSLRTNSRFFAPAALIVGLFSICPAPASFWYLNETDQPQSIRVKRIGIIVVTRYRTLTQTAAYLRGYYDSTGLQTFFDFVPDSTTLSDEQDTYTYDIGTTTTTYVLPPSAELFLDDDRSLTVGDSIGFWTTTYPDSAFSPQKSGNWNEIFDVGPNVLVQGYWRNTMEYCYTYSVSVLPAEMTSPASINATIPTSQKWTPAFSNVRGSRSTVFCIAGFTNWQSEPWTPPGPGTYTFYVGSLPAAGYVGNLEDPLIGSIQCDGKSYTVLVE